MGAALVVLVIASMLVFLGVRAIPGDPAIALAGEDRDPNVVAQLSVRSCDLLGQCRRDAGFVNGDRAGARRLS